MKSETKNTKTAVFVVMTTILALCAPAAQAVIPDWPEIFDPDLLVTINLDFIIDSDWDVILNNLPEPDGCLLENIYKPAWMWATGEESSKILVAVRRKKSFSFPIADPNNPVKVSLKIDINRLVPHQEWHGLEKLSL